MSTTVRDMPREMYDAEPRESWSKLRRIDKSPRHYQHGSEEETTAQRFGTLVHLVTLEPQRASEVAVWGLLPEQKVRNGKRWEEFEAQHAGKLIVTKAEMEAAESVAAAVRADPYAAPLLTGGSAEVSVLWQCEGIPFKSRLDYVRPDAIVDLKKVQSASPQKFAASIWNYRLDGQAAMYQRAWAAASGAWLPFYWVAVEEKPPHVVQVYRAAPHMLERGWEYCASLIEQLRFCRLTGSWPGYASGILDADYPAFAHRELEEDAA